MTPYGMTKALTISIHALREEGDVDEVLPGDTFQVFLSTPSARRATAGKRLAERGIGRISIHALREEGDSKNREKIPAFIPL